MLQLDRLWDSISKTVTTRQGIAIFSAIIGLITGNILTTNHLLRITFEDGFSLPTLEFGEKPTHIAVDEIIPKRPDDPKINNVLGDKGFFQVDLIADRINKYYESRYLYSDSLLDEQDGQDGHWADRWLLQVDSTLKRRKHFHIFDEGLINNLKIMNPHHPLIRKLHSVVSDPDGPMAIRQVLVEFTEFNRAKAAACTTSGFYNNDVGLIRRHQISTSPYFINVGVSNPISCRDKKDEDVCKQWNKDDPIANEIISKNDYIQISFEDAAQLFPEKIKISESGEIIENRLRRCEVAYAYLTQKHPELITN